MTLCAASLSLSIRGAVWRTCRKLVDKEKKHNEIFHFLSGRHVVGNSWTSLLEQLDRKYELESKPWAQWVMPAVAAWPCKLTHIPKSNSTKIAHAAQHKQALQHEHPNLFLSDLESSTICFVTNQHAGTFLGHVFLLFCQEVSVFVLPLYTTRCVPRWLIHSEKKKKNFDEAEQEEEH